jgi:hypothetical protein
MKLRVFSEHDKIRQSSNIAGRFLMPVANIKTEAQRLVDQLPVDATWEDLMYKIYVRQAVEAGLADSEAGQTTDVKDVRAQFGLPE